MTSKRRTDIHIKNGLLEDKRQNQQLNQCTPLTKAATALVAIKNGSKNNNSGYNHSRQY